MTSSGKVMIVDDQAGIRYLLLEVLRADGYDTFEASSGEQAFESSYEFQPDLILLDMKLPGMDGMQILRKFREVGSKATIMMMTAYSELDTVREAVRAGADGYFTKPFDILAMRDVIKEKVALQKSHYVHPAI
jgi:two-component system response regulator (stage 0 sporulation protein F)